MDGWMDGCLARLLGWKWDEMEWHVMNGLLVGWLAKLVSGMQHNHGVAFAIHCITSCIVHFKWKNLHFCYNLPCFWILFFFFSKSPASAKVPTDPAPAPPPPVVNKQWDSISSLA